MTEESNVRSTSQTGVQIAGSESSSSMNGDARGPGHIGRAHAAMLKHVTKERSKERQLLARLRKELTNGVAPLEKAIRRRVAETVHADDFQRRTSALLRSIFAIKGEGDR